MSVNRAFIVLHLLVAGEARLIRTCLYAIPLIFCIIFYSFQLGSKIITYFESYMEESYIGTMGELTLSTPSSSFVSELYQDAEQASLNVSKKFSVKSLVGIKTSDQSIIKGLDVLVYDSGYLASKFDGLTSPGSSLIISSVVAKQLGLTEQNTPISLYDPQRKQEVSFSHVLIVDLGFLRSDPVIIISAINYEKLIGEVIKYNQLEFHRLPLFGQKKVEDLARYRFNQGTFSSYKITDTQSLTSEHQEVFGALNWLSYVLFIILILLNFLLSVLAVNTVLKAKKNAIHTMKLLGMTSQELWGYVLITWLFLLSTSYTVSYVALLLTERQVLYYIFSF